MPTTSPERVADAQEMVWKLEAKYGPVLVDVIDQVSVSHRLAAIEVPTSPFTKATGLPRLRTHWARPEIVVQIAFIEWTKHDKLRHPRLLGVRPDKDAKDAREVRRET